MRVLFVGPLWRGSNATSMAEGFAQAGHSVLAVDTTRLALPRIGTPSWVRRKLGRTGDLARRIAERVERCAEVHRPDLLFCFKTVLLDQDRLLSTPVPLKVHYSADDVSNAANVTEGYLRHEHRWDRVVTTKRHNVEELLRRGARDVVLVRSAYSPSWHHPVAPQAPPRYSVGFIGNHRPDRSQLLRDVGARSGGSMVVHGPYAGWRRAWPAGAPGVHLRPAAYGEDFSTAVSRITANLVLLNSDNRDTHTCRSYEVPAAAGLFVGERTDEHQEMLEEGREALMFSSTEELHDVLARLRREPAARVDALRFAGHRRVVAGGNTYADRVRQITAD